MSKTFKSKHPESVLSIQIGPDHDGTGVHVRVLGASGLQVSKTDAPAIALAILSAAGVEPLSEHYGANDDPVAMMRHAAHFLARHATLSEAAAKEAADLQELEAAAWDLFKATSPDAPGTEFGNNHSSRKVWLNVARKARELFGGTK